MRINWSSPQSMRNLALVTAVLLAPLLSFGAASLMDMQKGSVSSSRVPLVKATPVLEAEALPAELIQQISDAIVLAEH